MRDEGGDEMLSFDGHASYHMIRIVGEEVAL